MVAHLLYKVDLRSRVEMPCGLGMRYFRRLPETAVRAP